MEDIIELTEEELKEIENIDVDAGKGDISVWQKDMNLSQAKVEGVNFAIIRGAYGNKKDTAFESNYAKAKANNLGVGVYWWTRAVNEAQAKEEAQLLIDNCLKGKQFEYPIYIDVEDSLLSNLGTNI